MEVYGEDPAAILMSLIETLQNKYERKVVVLIDEYDAPILNEITNEGLASEIRKILESFYSVLKDAAKYLRFVFLTGVTKFSQTSIFSGANQLIDISLAPDYANICGFTLDEFEELFPDHMNEVLLNLKKKKLYPVDSTIADLKSEILTTYDGYSWDGETRVLNHW
jgi:hypothetical protein